MNDEDILQVSILTIYELQYSCENAPSNKKQQISNTIESIKKTFEIVPLKVSSSELYGKLKTALKQDTGKASKEMLKYNIDLMIASMAIGESSILISADHLYRKIQTLHSQFRLENWIE